MRKYPDLAYVPGGRSRQKLDLYLPEGGKMLPLILWIHGGGYMSGSKKDGVPLAYLERGFAVASVNYRLSQDALFPAQMEDLTAALRWLRTRAEEFRLDPGRFAAWGESAGGHLAALLGVAGGRGIFDADRRPEAASRVQAVVDYFGPTDFLQMDAQRLPGGMRHDPPDSPESRLMGGAIQERKSLVAKANPISYATRYAPPFLIVHGDCDPLVPYGQSLLLREALAAQGVPVTLYTVVDGGHGKFKDPKLAPATAEFLEAALRAGR